ncbi:MAG: Magnesium and cobalt efflux protein CorC [Methanobacteriota archaeon]|jgi:CBS domain containing-hemolysin-like protein|nr:MAG: Magnesium and cobalt efflux protein CorC [Euryarchaeota archaeon]
MADYTMLIIYASLALGVSFLCSMLEAVLLSMSVSQVSIMEKTNDKIGKIWSKLKEEDSVKPLTAILTLNTIAHTMGAAGVGAEVQSQIGDTYLTIASVILTLAVLIFSEIIPKTIGAAYWKSLASPAGYLLNLMTKMMSPLFIPLMWFKKLLPTAATTIVTRDELAALADIGEEEGTLEEDEETVIHNLLKLREIPIADVMTPRTVTTAFDQSWSIRQVLDDTPVLRFGRLPIYGESIDDLTGFVIRSDLLMSASRDEWDSKLSEFVKPLLTIKTIDSVDLALERFLESKQQILAVIDEFGGTAGIVTMEDVIETLLGEEIVDELDEHEDMRKLAMEQAEASEEE